MPGMEPCAFHKASVLVLTYSPLVRKFGGHSSKCVPYVLQVYLT